MAWIQVWVLEVVEISGRFSFAELHFESKDSLNCRSKCIKCTGAILQLVSEPNKGKK